MVRVEFKDGSRQTASDPLTQWDYGQELRVANI